MGGDQIMLRLILLILAASLSSLYALPHKKTHSGRTSIGKAYSVDLTRNHKSTYTDDNQDDDEDFHVNYVEVDNDQMDTQQQFNVDQLDYEDEDVDDQESYDSDDRLLQGSALKEVNGEGYNDDEEDGDSYLDDEFSYDYNQSEPEDSLFNEAAFEEYMDQDYQLAETPKKEEPKKETKVNPQKPTPPNPAFKPFTEIIIKLQEVSGKLAKAIVSEKSNNKQLLRLQKKQLKAFGNLQQVLHKILEKLSEPADFKKPQKVKQVLKAAARKLKSSNKHFQQTSLNVVTLEVKLKITNNERNELNKKLGSLTAEFIINAEKVKKDD
ncbi:hypothetical protein HDV02_000814 [Globomyces sp. JEL0801]|nr:hypothetical protein HDV02_000814 [Globomyces sp. JEL0801]